MSKRRVLVVDDDVNLSRLAGMSWKAPANMK